MDNYINIQGFKVFIDFREQTSKNGRPFRLSGISLVTTKPAIWIDKRLTHGTIYTFRYLDVDAEFFGFEFTPDGKFLCKVTIRKQWR